MKNEVHLPKLEDSGSRTLGTSLEEEKAQLWTPLPQVWICAKWRDEGSKRFFFSQRPISYDVSLNWQGFVTLE